MAGGRARRFAGQDKSRLVVEGRTIIVRQVEILQRVAHPVFIVGHDAGRFADLGLPVHPDAIANSGAIGGIYTALTIDGPETVIVVACDMPFLDGRLLSRLVEMSASHDGAWVRTPRGVDPLLACYRRHAAPIIRAEIEGGRLKATALDTVLHMADMTLEEVATYGPPERLLANVNSPGDYARVQYGGS